MTARRKKSRNALFELDETRRARQVRAGAGRHRGRYIDWPEGRLSPQTVMSLSVPKPVVAALGLAHSAWIRRPPLPGEGRDR